MKVTQLIPGVFGDTLLDVTPPRPNELKTSEDFQRELESDRYSREEILRAILRLMMRRVRTGASDLRPKGCGRHMPARERCSR